MHSKLLSQTCTPQRSFRNSQGDILSASCRCSLTVKEVCCIMALEHLVLFLLFCYPYSNSLGNNGNHTGATLSEDRTVINSCHCSNHGYNNCRGGMSHGSSSFQFWLSKITLVIILPKKTSLFSPTSKHDSFAQSPLELSYQGFSDKNHQALSIERASKKEEQKTHQYTLLKVVLTAPLEMGNS